MYDMFLLNKYFKSEKQAVMPEKLQMKFINFLGVFITSC